MSERGDRRRMQRVRAHWSARFEGSAGPVVGHVVDLSMVSVRIRPAAGASVAVGQSGTLTLAFSDSTDHMEVIRLTASAIRVGVDGIALGFTGLPESASRWLGARVITTEVRRRAPRVALSLPIELRKAGAAPFSAETLDLSAYGARVKLPDGAALQPGERVRAKLELSPGQPMSVPAVAWSIEGAEAVLMFVNLGPREFNRLGDQVASRIGARR